MNNLSENWIYLKSKDPIERYSIKWDRKTKKWSFVTKYGDGAYAKRWDIIAHNPEIYQLNVCLEHISRKITDISYYNRQISFAYLTALTLYYAGVETIKPCTGFIAGKKRFECVQLHQNSFVFAPYITHPVCNGQNILWWILKNLGMSYGGGACDKWMQAYTRENGFLRDVCVYFLAFQAAEKEIGKKDLTKEIFRINLNTIRNKEKQ